MQIFNSIREVNSHSQTVITIGNFDGVHRGHQALLQTVIDAAAVKGPGTASALITFEPHPLRVLRPKQPLELLTTPLERLQLAAELGVDLGVIQPFTLDLAAMEAREFLAMLKSHLGMATLVVGPDFALGHNRSGTLDTLAELGDEMGYQLIVQDHIAAGERSVRSRAVRELIGAGDVRDAADLLGRPYHIAGIVEHGDQRGRHIGVPTANISVPEDKLWPAHGVYATRTWVPDGELLTPYFSVTNAGFRPTVNGRRRRLESHLLDFPAQGASSDLYDKRLVVEFIERLRGEVRFESLDALVAQIERDIEQACTILRCAELPEKSIFAVEAVEAPI